MTVNREKLIGREITLHYMDGETIVPPGTKGIIQAVDDIGTIHVLWDNGVRIGVVPDVDRFVIGEKKTPNI